MSVFEKALRSIALTLADEAELYNVTLPPAPDTSDSREIINYLKQVANAIVKASGSTVADKCLETLEKFLDGKASDDEIMTNCPIAEDIPESALEPFKKRFWSVLLLPR